MDPGPSLFDWCDGRFGSSASTPADQVSKKSVVYHIECHTFWRCTILCSFHECPSNYRYVEDICVSIRYIHCGYVEFVLRELHARGVIYQN
jgi:hypothetical protein